MLFIVDCLEFNFVGKANSFVVAMAREDPAKVGSIIVGWNKLFTASTEMGIVTPWERFDKRSLYCPFLQPKLYHQILGIRFSQAHIENVYIYIFRYPVGALHNGMLWWFVAFMKLERLWFWSKLLIPSPSCALICLFFCGWSLYSIFAYMTTVYISIHDYIPVSWVPHLAHYNSLYAH